MKKILSLTFAIAFLAISSGLIQAQVVFDDAVNGFASSNGAAPEQLIFNLGSNVVNGTVTSGGLDPAGNSINNTRNFYTFSIGPGEELSGIEVLALTSTNDDPGFFALINGTTGVNPADGFANLGGTLFGAVANANISTPTPVGTNLLPLISGGGISGGSGFGTLGEGDFTFVIQQTGPEINEFSLDFQVSAAAVPEPSSAILLTSLAGLIGIRRRRS